MKPRWRNMCWDTEGGLCGRWHECAILLGSRTNSSHPERASSMYGRDATKSREIHRVLQRKVYDTPASYSKQGISCQKCWLWKLVKNKIWFSSITAFLLPQCKNELTKVCAVCSPEIWPDHQRVGGQMEIGLKTGKVTCFISLSLVASQHIVLSTLAAIASLTRWPEQVCWVNWGRFGVHPIW